MNKYMPKPGDYVQIWKRHQAEQENAYVNGHGRLGYVVKKWSDTVDNQGPIYQVICFGSSSPERFNVWYGWLNRITKSTDIKGRD